MDPTCFEFDEEDGVGTIRGRILDIQMLLVGYTYYLRAREKEALEEGDMDLAASLCLARRDFSAIIEAFEPDE